MVEWKAYYKAILAGKDAQIAALKPGVKASDTSRGLWIL